MIFRKLEENEIKSALDLVWKVFLEFEAPDYSQEGINEFYRSINDKKYLDMLKWYGAFDDKKIVGVIATRNNGNHISLFFVEGVYHEQGIGRKLFEMIVKDNSTGMITVNSAPFAVNIYHHLGFKYKNDDKIKVENGIMYVPMEYKKYN